MKGSANGINRNATSRVAFLFGNLKTLQTILSAVKVDNFIILQENL